MNNFFSLDVDGNSRPVFEKYMVKRISNKTNKEIEEMNIRINSFQNKYKSIFSKLSSLSMLLSFPFILIGLSYVIFQNITYALIGIIGFVICLGLSFLFMFLEYKKTKKINNSEEYIALNNDAERLIKKAYLELGIKEELNGIDCYFNYYKNKNGKLTSSLLYKSLMVKEYLVYKDELYLYFVDVYALIKIPLSSIKGLNQIDNSINFYGWNKKELPSSDKYKKYKIKTLNNMYFKIPSYWSLDIELDGEEYSILIANYDKEIVKNLLIIND